MYNDYMENSCSTVEVKLLFRPYMNDILDSIMTPVQWNNKEMNESEN